MKRMPPRVGLRAHFDQTNSTAIFAITYKERLTQPSNQAMVPSALAGLE
jgi:hypothetical protein